MSVPTTTTSSQDPPRLISLKHIKEPYVPPVVAVKSPRMAPRDGRVTTNSDEAVAAFLRRKLAAGNILTEQQRTLLEKFYPSAEKAVKTGTVDWKPLNQDPSSSSSSAAAAAASAMKQNKNKKNNKNDNRGAGGGGMVVIRRSDSNGSSGGGDGSNKKRKFQENNYSGASRGTSPVRIVKAVGVGAGDNDSDDDDDKARTQQQRSSSGNNNKKVKNNSSNGSSNNNNGVIALKDKLSMSLEDLAKLRK